VRVATVYNFTVAQTHTYYIATDTSSTLVHNGFCGFTDHGAEQASIRGISRDMVRQAVATGRRGKGRSDGTRKFSGRKVWVVLNRSGKVISTGWNRR